MRITIRHGTGNDLTKEFPNGSTLGSVLADPQVKADLGYGDNVAGFIGGVPQDESIVLADGATISVHDRSCEKSREVFKEDGYKFSFYEGEVLRREPPHVHVARQGKTAKFWLRPTVRLAKNGQFKQHELNEILRLIERNLDMMVSSWKDACRASGQTLS